MAKLEGLLKLVGTLEGLTICKTKDGFVVKKKWGPDVVRTTDYLVEETFYDKQDLDLKEMPARLTKIRESYMLTNDDIVWEDD